MDIDHQKHSKEDKERFTRSELLFLCLLVLLIAPLYSYLSFSTDHWFMHPDDREVYFMSKAYFDTGHLYVEEPLHAQFKFPFLLPEGSTFRADRILPQRALGIYLLLAPSFAFGTEAPFLFISLMGILCVIIFYLLTKELFNRRTAMLAAFFFSFSFPMIYWSNMLFSNVPALLFYLAGVYFLIRADKGKAQMISFSLAAALFALTVWLRYEYVLMVGFIGMFYCLKLYKTLFAKKDGEAPHLSYHQAQEAKERHVRLLVSLAVAAAVFALILSPMLILNKAVYGNMLSIGYTTGYNFDSLKVTYGGEKDLPQQSILEKVTTLFARFTGQFKSYDTQILWGNLKQFLFFTSPVLVFFGVFGIFYTLLKKKMTWFMAYVLTTIAFLCIYFGGGVYWGLDTNWISSSYSRYFMIIFAFFSMFTAKLLLDLLEFLEIQDWLKLTITTLLIAYYVIYSLNVAFNAPLALTQSKDLMDGYKAVDDRVSKLPEKSIIVSNFYSKSILSRKVMTPDLFSGSKIDKAADILKQLDAMGYNLYVIENEKHKSFMNIAELLEHRGFKKQLVSEHPVDIYKVTYGS